MPDLFAFTTIQYWMFFQVLARVSALIAVAPVFGAREVPAPVKIGLAVILSLTLTPLASTSLRGEGVPTTFYGMAGPLAIDALIGLVMGFIASLIIATVQMAGALLDLQAGFSLAQAFNPALADESAPISTFQSMYAVLLFLLARGHYILIEAVARSFHAAPAAMVNFGSAGTLRFFVEMTSDVMLNALRIAAPAAAVLLVIDISFAFVARAMPQMNVFFVGMPLKSLVGIALVALVLPLFALMVGQLVAHSPLDLGHLFAGIKV